MQGDIGSTYQEENNKNTLRVVWTCVDDTEGTSEKNRSHEFYSNEKEQKGDQLGQKIIKKNLMMNNILQNLVFDQT